MSTTSARLPRLLALGALVMLVAACSSSAGGAGWTYAPPVTTPSAGAGGSPAASGSAAATASSAPTGGATVAPTVGTSPASSPQASSPAASGGGGSTVIQLDETADLHITDPSGTVVSSITVQNGQTYTFEITNTAGYDHDFYIGSPDDLKAANTADLKGVPAFASGTQTFQYTFAGPGPTGFGCTLPGHYQTMNGLFVIQ